MSSKAEASASGIGFFGLLTVVFITLKLTEVIDWSWWLVLGALWMPITAVLAVALIAGLVWLILEVMKKK